MKTVAITGTSGLLGQHIEANLKINKYNVISINRSSDVNSSNLRNWNLTDIKTNDDFDFIFEDADAIVHSAAIVPTANINFSDEEIYRANVLSVMQLSQWCRINDIPLVYISGAIVYENSNTQNLKENSCKGWNGFGGYYA